jgi:uncharacterized protein (TIGR02452 family)
MVFKDTEEKHYADISNPFLLDFIACPGLKNPELVFDDSDAPGRLSAEDISILEDKVRLIFQVGVQEGHDSLVLGALGCGAWRNPAKDVAQTFKRVISENRGTFKEIVFAIMRTPETTTRYHSYGSRDTENYAVFKEVLEA